MSGAIPGRQAEPTPATDEQAPTRAPVAAETPPKKPNPRFEEALEEVLHEHAETFRRLAE